MRFAFTLFGLVVLSSSIAYWSWHWWGPAATPRPVLVSDADSAAKIVDAHLFGRADVVPTTATIAGTDASLLGTFSESGGRGYALVRVGGRARLLAIGDTLPDGTKLTAVRPDAIVLNDGASERELTLRPRAAAVKTAGKVALGSGAGCTAPPGFSGGVYRLNAELLGGMATTPETWKGLLQAGEGALVVRDQNGFGAMLGLRNGDRLERANGIILRAPEDVVAAVLRPLTRSLPVELVGKRDGVSRQWLYLNAGTCPA